MALARLTQAHRYEGLADLRADIHARAVPQLRHQAAARYKSHPTPGFKKVLAGTKKRRRRVRILALLDTSSSLRTRSDPRKKEPSRAPSRAMIRGPTAKVRRRRPRRSESLSRD